MKRNEFLKQYISGIENAAEQLQERMMPDLSQELFLQYEKTGNRLEYEKNISKEDVSLLYLVCAQFYQNNRRT